VPWLGGTGGGDPDLGPYGLLDGRLPSDLPREAASLGRTHCPVSQISHALQGRTSSVEKDHRSPSQGNDDWRIPGRGVGDDKTSEMQERVRRQDLLQAGVRQGRCSGHLNGFKTGGMSQDGVEGCVSCCRERKSGRSSNGMWRTRRARDRRGDVMHEEEVELSQMREESDWGISLLLRGRGEPHPRVDDAQLLQARALCSQHLHIDVKVHRLDLEG